MPDTSHIPTKLTGLTDLPRPHRAKCECGQLARYALPVQIQPATEWHRNESHILYLTMHLCGRCLALEMQARRSVPLSSDID